MKIFYEGPAAYASAVAQSLESAGISVDYQPAMEKRDASSAAELVGIWFSIKVADNLTDHVIDAALDSIRATLAKRIPSIRLRREKEDE